MLIPVCPVRRGSSRSPTPPRWRLRGEPRVRRREVKAAAAEVVAWVRSRTAVRAATRLRTLAVRAARPRPTWAMVREEELAARAQRITVVRADPEHSASCVCDSSHLDQ